MGRVNYKDIELRQLRSFLLAATHSNFSAAARDLGVSVPAIWEQVRALERTLGASLLLHHKRGLELTPEGRLVLELTQPHVSGLDSLAPLFQARRKELPPRLSVVANQNILANRLPAPVQEFTRRHPDVRLQLFGDPRSSEMAHLIETGKADLGVLAVDWDETQGLQLEQEHLFDLQFMLLASRDHPLAHKKRIRPEDLVEHPIMTMPAGSPNRKALERLLGQHNLMDRLHIIIENMSTDVIRKYVALGIGIALMYVSDKVQAHSDLHMRVIDPKIGRLPVALVKRRFAHLPAHAQEFQQIVRRHLAGERRSRSH